MAVRVVAVDRPDLPPLTMPERFRHEVAYFMSIPGPGEGPTLTAGEYWIRREDARNWLEEGVFCIVSPLDSANRTELELSEEQEEWLEWLIREGIEHIRLE
jgi:hypothetical protein